MCRRCARAYMRMHQALHHDCHVSLDGLYLVQRFHASTKTQEQKRSLAAASARWRAQHPAATRAKALVRKALQSGVLVRQPCETCGASPRVKRNRVWAHHDDYTKPLEVRWLCFKCHVGKVHHRMQEFSRRRP